MDALMISPIHPAPANGELPQDEVDRDEQLRLSVLDGDIDALLRWRQLLDPIDYDELGWAD